MYSFYENKKLIKKLPIHKPPINAESDDNDYMREGDAIRDDDCNRNDDYMRTEDCKR